MAYPTVHPIDEAVVYCHSPSIGASPAAAYSRAPWRGKIIKIGSTSSFVAKQSGTLQFAIGMRPEFVGRYQFTGKYDVTVRVLRGGR